jgi:hypothetical protein
MNNGLEFPGVLDALVHDSASGKAILAMYERRPWEGADQQLSQLQDKLNAYLSFALDGEMTEAFPQLAGQPLEIQLRTVHEIDLRAADLIRRMREQLAFQKIGFEVIQATPEELDGQSSGGGSCGCQCDCG